MSLSLSLSGTAIAQDLYVHARTGCDANTGTSPAAPRQTITSALATAAGTPGIARTIWIAGAFAGGQRIPYDDVANVPNPACSSSPQGQDAFPLQMLGGVSLVWWVAGSDIDTTTNTPARPLVREGVPYANPAGLVEFGTSYSMGPSPVAVTSLDLEAATSGVSVFGAAAVRIAPSLTDLRILDCANGVRLLPNSNKIAPLLDRCEIALQASGPLAAGSALLVVSQVAGASSASLSTLGGTITGCRFRVESSPSFAAGAGVLLQCLQYGRVENLTIEGCSFEGGAPNPTSNDGMQWGVYATSYAYFGSPTYPVAMSLVGNEVKNCRRSGFRFRGIPFTGLRDTAPSTITISGNRFEENVAAPGLVPPDEAHVFIDIGQGKLATFAISSNTMLHTRGNALTVLNPTAGGYFGFLGPPNVTLTFEQNQVQDPEMDGVHLVVSSMNLTSTIRRNRIASAGGNGVLNRVQYATGTGYLAQSNPDMVNNFIIDSGGDGIRNEADSPVPPMGNLSAAPRITYNTVAFSGGFGLRNLAIGAAPYQSFPVTNSIFRDSGGADLGPTAGLLPLNVTFCNFLVPDPFTIGANNNNDPPSFVDPAPGVRDLHLASGSQLVDRGTDTPPAAPGVDFDGDLRPFDVGPTGPPNQTGDIGADERTGP